MARVNSYITKGKGTYHGADKDLREEEMDESLWANIHAKRERIKRGSGERMRKPGSKGAPTADALRQAREETEIVDRPPPSDKTKRRHQEIKKKIIDEDKPAEREIGTDSLVKKYKKDTPGQDKGLNENFNMAWTAGIGVTLSAEQCGIKMKPAFELHPDVIAQMDEMEEEVRSADVEGVVVRTSDGKTIVRKQKRNKKIIGTGNLTDGKPDDTL
jgi:hypothetical protein